MTMLGVFSAGNQSTCVSYFWRNFFLLPVADQVIGTDITAVSLLKVSLSRFEALNRSRPPGLSKFSNLVVIPIGSVTQASRLELCPRAWC